MKLITRLSAFLILGALAVFHAAGQQLPIQQNQDASVFNYQSVRGVPISNTNGVPVGSDGRAPGPASGSTGTPGRYQSHVHFGAVVPITNRAGFNPGVSLIANAVALDLPRGTNGPGAVILVMSRARLGNPFASRTVSFLFGEVVVPPEKDEYGVDLSLPNAAKGRPNPVLPSDYWWREPYTTTAHTNDGYYYSPHAEQVYASQLGNIQVVWQRTAPSSLLGGSIGGAGNVFARGANRNVLTNRYVISATPFKTARRMYWTEGAFRDTGKPVIVPADRVQDLQVIYNNQVPMVVPEEVLINGQTASTVPVTNTFWYDNSVDQLRAYNVEGKLLLELLGDLRPEAGNGIRQQIGYEIIELIQRPAVDDDVTTELGEVITAFPGPTPADTPELTPEPLLSTTGITFDYRHSVPGTQLFDYYAVKETQTQNDYLVHWMESSIAGLRWPYRYVRYKFVWPTDVAKYTHYVRPTAATAGEAKATAVPMPSENAPTLVYQDALDQPRGGFTESFAYYSWLTPEYPAHRALLRFTSGGYVRFERVFSWLDEVLRASGSSIASAASSDFSLSFPNLNFGAAYGSAYMADGVLHLTDGGLSQNANYVVNDFYNNQVVASFRVRFKVRIGDTNFPPADGFGFSFGRIPNNTYQAYPAYLSDEGTDDGIAVNFDLWDNSEVPADWAPGIAIKTNGVNLAGVAIGEPGLFDFRPDPALLPAPRDPATGNFLALTTGTNYVPVEIDLYPGGAMNVSYRGVKVLDRVPTSFTPRTGRFGFSARTGSRWASHWIDDLSIEVNPGLVTANPALAGTPAATLDSWIDGKYFHWPDRSTRPLVSEQVADVGQRLSPPDGEIGGGLDTNYLAGYVRAGEGDSYLPGAYFDPLSVGFDLANNGAIIPVNAVPGRNRLEVWWFRRNHVDITRGFRPILWPAVISRYTLRWPQTAAEIVLASNDGSGPLSSLEAKGSIYYQNNPALPGYNPNEEHALMQGGQAYALRDDLNVTSGDNYSSDPFVLLQYTASDGRPAMRPFKVRRENPENGITFEYNKPAGSILQAPMPLPLLGPAFAPKIAGQPRVALTEELVSWNVRTSDVGTAPQTNTWQLEIEGGRHGIPIYQTFVLQDPQQASGPIRFFFSTGGTENSVEGVISTNRPYALTAFADGFLSNEFVFTATSNTVATFAGWLNRVVVVQVGTLAGTATYEARVKQVITVPNPIIELAFTAGRPAQDLFQAHRILAVQPVAGYADAQFDRWRVAWNEALNGGSEDLRNRYAKATLADRKGNIWVYRGPHLPDRPETFAMRYYYRTLPGFYFPSRTADQQPAVGTATPYLRARGADGEFIGDPVFGNADQNQASDRNALAILYHPVWP